MGAASAAIILTPGLLMPVRKPVVFREGAQSFALEFPMTLGGWPLPLDYPRTIYRRVQLNAEWMRFAMERQSQRIEALAYQRCVQA